MKIIISFINYIFLYVTNMSILKEILHISMEESEVSALHINQGRKHTVASGIPEDVNILYPDF